VATFYFLDVATALESLHDFWASVSVTMPPVVHIGIVSSGDKIDDATGDLVGSWGGTPQAEVVGSGGDQFAAPAGVVVTWTTDTILDSHRLMGRTFIVPLSYGSYQNDGSIGSTTLPNFDTPANTFLIAQSSSFVVWHRPRKARAAVGKLKALTAHDGGHGLVTGVRVRDRVAVLTSRR